MANIHTPERQASEAFADYQRRRRAHHAAVKRMCPSVALQAANSCARPSATTATSTRACTAKACVRTSRACIATRWTAKQAQEGVMSHSCICPIAEAIKAATAAYNVLTERDALNFILGFLHHDDEERALVKGLLEAIAARDGRLNWKPA